MHARVFDRVGPRERLIAQRRERLEIGIECAHGQLDADLVVAFPGAAVSDGIGAVTVRRLDEQGREQAIWMGSYGIGRDQRPRQCGRERVDAFVERVRAQRRQGVVIDEAFLRVDQERVVGAERERFGLHLVQRCRSAGAGGAVALAEIERHRDHAMSLEHVPFQQHGGIEPPRISQDDRH